MKIARGCGGATPIPVPERILRADGRGLFRNKNRNAAADPRRLERLAQPEVEPVRVLALLLGDGEADVEAQQAEGRVVPETEAHGVAQVEPDVVHVRVDVPRVVEDRAAEPRARVPLPQLLVDDDHRLAAEREAVGALRPE